MTELLQSDMGTMALSALIVVVGLGAMYGVAIVGALATIWVWSIAESRFPKSGSRVALPKV